MIILRAISPKYWKSLFIEFFRYFKHKDKLEFRVKIQEILWNDKLNSELFFKKIFNSNFFKLLIRKQVLDYCISLSKTNRILFLTANEKNIIEVFLKIYVGLNNPNISIIGSDFKKDKFKINKGIEKLNSLKLFLSKINYNHTIYNFFDSYSDLHLAKICDFNIVIGKSNYYKLKKINPNLIYFNSYISKLKA